MSAHAPHGIRSRVAMLVATGTVAALAVAGAAASSGLEAMQRELLVERQALATALAVQVDRTVEQVLESLTAAASGAVDPDFALRATWARWRAVAGVFRTDADGRVVLEEPARLLEEDVPAEARAHGEAAFRFDARRGRVRIAVPRRDLQGRTIGTVGMVLDMTHGQWASLLGPGVVGPEASADVVAADGRVVASSSPARVGQAGPGAHACADASADDVAACAPLSFAPWTVMVRQPRPEAQAPVRRMRWRLIAAAPVLLALGLLFAWGAALGVTQPVAALRTAAERIAGGDLGAPVPVLPADEVGALGVALERMRVELKASLDAVGRANASLEARVAERTRDIERLMATLRDRDAARARLLHKVISAQEDERKRIARELHDQTCQALSALAMRIDAHGGLTPLRELATHALDDVHTLILGLRPAVLDDLGLVPAIRWLGARHLAPAGVSFRCEAEGLDERLPSAVETTVFRFVQEALVNVARHAEASTVLVQMERGPSRLEVEIEDDGRGFDPDEVAAAEQGGRGLGLMGLRERAELLGGTACIESAPGRGTRVVLRVPLEALPALRAPAAEAKVGA